MAKSAKRLKFEDAMARLDEIVEAMEAGEIGIEESIARYEEAMQLASHCRGILDHVEQRIRQIQFDASGQPQVTPFATAEPDTDNDTDDQPPAAGQ